VYNNRFHSSLSFTSHDPVGW